MMEERSQMAREARKFAVIGKDIEPLKEFDGKPPNDVDNTEVPLLSFTLLIHVNVH